MTHRTYTSIDNQALIVPRVVEHRRRHALYADCERAPLNWENELMKDLEGENWPESLQRESDEEYFKALRSARRRGATIFVLYLVGVVASIGISVWMANG